MIMSILRSKKITKRILLVLLVLIIPAFVLWGAGSLTSKSKSVGQIGRSNISDRDLAESRQGIQAQLLFSYYGDFGTLNKLLQNRAFLNSMAWERLILLNSAKKAKIKVTDAMIMQFISQHPLFVRAGIFDPQAYSYILRNTLGVDPHRFEELTRENMQTYLFRQEITKDITVSDTEVLEAYNKDHDKITFSYLLVPKTLFLEKTAISEKDAEKFYENNKTSFLDPAKTVIEYMKLSYNDASEKKDIKKKIDTFYSKLQENSQNFSAIAEENGFLYKKTNPFSSTDIIPGVNFLKLFRDAAKTLDNIGNISLPVFSPGDKGTVYILRKSDYMPEQQRSFETAKNDIFDLIKDDNASALAKTKAQELYKKISYEEVSFENAAQELQLEIIKTPPVTSKDYIDTLGSAANLVMNARKVKPGDFLAPVTIKPGTIIVRVEAITPDASEFAAQKDALSKSLLQTKQSRASQEWFKNNNANANLLQDLNKL